MSFVVVYYLLNGGGIGDKENRQGGGEPEP